MYDPKTGRGYDGIDNKKKINKNSGAESTIEALMTLMEISDNPISLRYFYYDLESVNEIKRYALYKGVDAQEFRVDWDDMIKRWKVEELK